MSIDRRKLFALGGLGAVGAGTGALGAEHDARLGAITVQLTHWDGKWCVWVPDMSQRWRPGMHVALKRMPLDEFLAALEVAYG